MMGTKARNFAPLINVSLEDLVPQDHFYRHLDKKLDLSFVREFVQQTRLLKKVRKPHQITLARNNLSVNDEFIAR
jgi:hypothetical protein